ncbi:endo alpha-1,4 polygalactosaminidase [Nocardia sp. CA-119907]|uniref:endo alpha-1,4 polygalactosaminidase n=1 Tax=Nocardia sp. CA-119907 TaxID=3239973 RepID=UPI003D98B131
MSSATVSVCATQGFHALEFDDLDSSSRSRGELTAADNLELAAAPTSTAHAAGLLAGQMNSAELSEQGRRQARCTPDAVCARPDRPRSTVIRDSQLVTPGTSGYFHRTCWTSRPFVTGLRRSSRPPCAPC